MGHVCQWWFCSVRSNDRTTSDEQHRASTIVHVSFLSLETIYFTTLRSDSAAYGWTLIQPPASQRTFKSYDMLLRVSDECSLTSFAACGPMTVQRPTSSIVPEQLFMYCSFRLISFILPPSAVILRRMADCSYNHPCHRGLLHNMICCYVFPTSEA